MHTFTIRKAERSDMAALLSLWRELHELHGAISPVWQAVDNPSQHVYEMFEKFLDTPENEVFVAEESGAVTGFLSVAVINRPEAFVHRRHGYVYDLAVTAARRRKGIGTALFAQGREWFASNGVSRVELSYALENPSAAGFWRKTGFIPYTHRCYLEI